MARRKACDTKKRHRTPWSRNQKIAVIAAALTAIGIVVSASVSIYNSIYKKQGIDENKLVAKITEASEAKGRAEGENQQLKKQVADAVHRVVELNAAGNRPDVEEILEKLRKNGDTTGLQQLLIGERNKNRDALIQRDREIAAVAYYRGDMQTVVTCGTEVLTLEPNDLPSLVLRGIGFGAQSRLTEAKADLVKAVNLAADAGDEMWQAIGYCNLGSVHYMLGELTQAEDMFNRSLKLGRDFENGCGMALCYAGLGEVLLSRGDLKRAKEMYTTALDILRPLDARDVGRRRAVATLYSGLACVYLRLGQLDDAEAMYRKALDIDQETGNTYAKGYDYGGLGDTYYARGDLDKAEKFYQDARRMSADAGDWSAVARDYAGLGNVYCNRGELDKSEGMYSEALKVSEAKGLVEVTATVYIGRGIVFTQRGDLDRAEVLFNKALKMSEP